MDFQSYWKYLILIETRSSATNFSFDTGVSKMIVNTDVLGINLADIETIILSHGHFDHISGLIASEKNKKADRNHSAS